MRKFLIMLLAFFCIAGLQGQTPGSIDAMFNPADNTSFGNGPSGEVHSAVQQPDGKIIIGGAFSRYHGIFVSYIVRLNTDGSIDRSFQVSLRNELAEVNSIALQADGKIIIGGNFVSVNGISKRNLARLNPDGSLDNSFNVGEIGPDSNVNKVLILHDGKIVIGGLFQNYNGFARRLALLNADGSLQATFAPDFIGSPTNIIQIAEQSDGKLLVAGSGLKIFANRSTSSIIRLNATGSPDNTFECNTGNRTNIPALALQPDGKIWIGGNFTTVNGSIKQSISRQMPNGENDNSFNPGIGFSSGNSVKPIVRSLQLISNNQVLAGGQYVSYNGRIANRIIKLNNDGSQYLGFRVDGDFPGDSSGFVRCITPLSNGNYLTGGNLFSTSPGARNNLAVINTNGSIDRTFNPRRGFNKIVNSVTVQPDGKVIAGGAFTSFNDTVNNYLARLLPNGSRDNTFSNLMDLNGPVFATALQPDGKILVAGNFTRIQGQQKQNLLRLLPGGLLDNSFSLTDGASDSIKTIAVRPDGRILIGGAFTKAGGVAANRIALLNADGTVQTSFSPQGANGTVNDLLVRSNNQIYVAGAFTSISGASRAGIAKLLASGAVDNSFVPNPVINGIVNAIDSFPTGSIILGGSFSQTIPSVTRNCITALLTSGAIDNNFAAGSGFTAFFTSPRLTDMVVQAGKRVVVAGYFAAYNNIFYEENRRMMTLLAVGQQDVQSPVYESGAGNPNDFPMRLALQGNNVITAGNFITLNESAKKRIARLLYPQTALNDLPCNAINLIAANPGDTSMAGLPKQIMAGASADPINFEPCNFIRDERADVWFKFTATDSTHFIITDGLGDIAPSLYLYEGTCNNIFPRLCVTTDRNYGNGRYILPQKKLVPGTEYYIKVVRFNNGIVSPFSIKVLTPANDEPCSAINVNPKVPGDTASSGAFNGSFYPATIPFNPNAQNSYIRSVGDVWYKFTATKSTHVIRVTGTPARIISLFNNNGCGYPTVSLPVKFSYTGAGFTNLTQGSVYLIQLTAPFGDFNPQFRLDVLTPENDAPCEAFPLLTGSPGDTTSVFTDGDYFLKTHGGNLSCNGVSNPDSWYKFTATANHHIIQAIGKDGQEINVSLYPAAICGNNSISSIFCKEQSGLMNASIPNLIIGSDYYIRIAKGLIGSGGTSFKLRILSSPSNDEKCNATALIPGAIGDTSATHATNGSFLLADISNTNAKDIWYKFQATSSSHIIKLNTSGPVKLRLWQYSSAANSCNNISPIGIFNNDSLSRYSNLVVGNTYLVQVLHETASTSSNDFSIAVLTPEFDESCTAKVITPLPKGIPSCASPIIGTTKFATGNNLYYSSNSDLWYQFTATDSAHIVNAFCNKGKFLEINIYRGGSCGAINPSPIIGRLRSGTGALVVGGKLFKPDSLYFIRIGNAQVNGANQDTYFTFCLQSGQNNTDPCSASIVIPAAAPDTSFTNPVSGNLLLGQLITRSSPNYYCPNVTNPGTVQELWYKFTATAASHFIRYTGPAKTGVRLHQSACPLAFNPIFCDTSVSANDMIPLTGLQVGSEYYLCFYIRQPLESILEKFDMQFKLLTPIAGYNDSICKAIPLGTCADTTGYVLFATPDVAGSVCGAGTVNEVWYKFTAPPSGILSVRSTTAGFTPKVRFITLGDCNNPLSITSQNCDFSELIQMTEFIAGTEYYMGVGISEADAIITSHTGNFSIQLANTTVIGVGYTASTATSICQATAVVFTASSSNAGANPGYEWLINDVFTGATGPVYVCDSLKNGDKLKVRAIPSISCLSPRVSQSTTFTVVPGTLYFKDADADGFGLAGTDTIACTPPVGYVTNSSDCNDADDTKNASFGFYSDADGDGFGVNPLLQVCAANELIAPAGYSLNNLDLDDNDAVNNPHSAKAEYFIDTDPGQGNGISLPFSGSLDSIQIKANISTTGLAAGFHTLGIRVFSQGTWSMFETRGFYLNAPDTEQAPVTEAEYFVDSDPGNGNALFSVSFANIDSASAQITIPLAGLAGGFHQVAVRLKDANGKWGLFEYRGFYIDSSFAEDALPDAAEYFLDNDPGVGNGTPIATPLPADTLQISRLLPKLNLAPGFHTLSFRIKDNHGTWGLSENRAFYINPGESASNPIVAAEYFLTTDPGTGVGINLPVDASTDSIDGTYTVVIPASVTPGNYLMGSRVKDNQGHWSHFEYDTVTVASNSTSLSLLFTNICAGTGTILPFTASGTYNAGNTFTAQLSNADGDFTNPTSIGSFAGTSGGNMPITIPANTTPGLGYRIRITSSSPPGAAIIGANGFSVNGTISTGDASASKVLAPQPNYLLDAQCRLLTALLPGGSSPVSGMVTGQVWVEDNVPLNNEVPFVGRHYQITPVANATTATATVTLYFTQAEFTAYNNHPNTTAAARLPASPNDADGISRLLVIKFSGSSSNGTGMPNSYTGDTTTIDPEDSAVIWNNSLQRWEVSFEVTGFSGFIVTASPNILTGPLPLTHYWTGSVSTDWFDAANWSNGVPTASGTAIIPGDRPNYPTIRQSTSVRTMLIEQGASVICEPGIQLLITGRQQSRNAILKAIY